MKLFSAELAARSVRQLTDAGGSIGEVEDEQRTLLRAQDDAVCCRCTGSAAVDGARWAELTVQEGSCDRIGAQRLGWNERRERERRVHLASS